MEAGEEPYGLKVLDVIEFLGPVDDPEDCPGIGERGFIVDIHDHDERSVVSWEEWGTYAWGTRSLSKRVRVVGNVAPHDPYLRKRDAGLSSSDQDG